MSAPQEEMPSGVALVMPAYDEEATIRELAQRALATGHPLIVVDDGSTDATCERLRDLPLELLRHPENRGKAAALWTGMRAALRRGASAVVTLDADGQHRPEDVPLLVAASLESPGHVIVGARLVDRDAAPLGRLVANRLADFFVSWAAGQSLADSQSGFRLYPRALLEGLGADFSLGRGFVFESEVLIVAVRRGFPCVFVPIEAIYPPERRRSHYRPAQDTLAIAGMLTRRIVGRGLHPRGFWRAFVRPARPRRR